ncbi:MAG: hypothetical protein JNJ98_03215 [Gemmatimonadetes bacterium]|nr:hypothetical protein [Gemmatimonadota bacterium]
MTHQEPTPASRRPRRGSALMLTMIFTLALGGLAISSIYMGASTSMLSKLYDRERDYRYAAEWALAIGESRITVDTTFTLPDSLYVQLMNGQTVTDALGQAVPKVKVDLYAGVGGQSSGQYGRFIELVAVAYDNGGARHVRRLELQAENFARYAMFVDQWPGSACYATGEILRGRAHSNQDWKNCGSAPGVVHTDTVSAVGNVTGTGQYQSAKLNGVPRINFPSVAKLSFMPGYASSANLSFVPNAVVGTVGGSRMEFVAVDLDGDSALTGPAEGYFRVFDSTVDTTRTRMSWAGNTTQVVTVLGGAQRINVVNHCGLNYVFDNNGDGIITDTAFVPLAVHDSLTARYLWFSDSIRLNFRPANRNGITSDAIRDARRGLTSPATTAATIAAFMLNPPAGQPIRCYPAGDPRLMPVERRASAMPFTGPLDPQDRRGGTDTTFSAVTLTGSWRAWPGWGGVSFFTPGVTRRQAEEEQYLWPIHRTQNLNSKGVIYVAGNVWLGGVFRGRATVYISGTGKFYDDLTYVTNPASLPICQNLLGIITGQNLDIIDGVMTRPRRVNGTAAANTRFFDDNQDFFLHAVTLTGVVNTSAVTGVENWGTGPSTGRQCTPVAGYTVVTSGGCIAQAGGVITRGLTATFAGSNTGFAENRVKDACLDVDSPPYFPLTGRYVDNEFFEIDPAVFNQIGVAQFFRRLQSSP